MIAQFVSQHPFISLGISHAFMFLAGYILHHFRNSLKINRLWDEWEASEEDPLVEEYLHNPIRDAVIPEYDDDWTGYQQAVRPTQTIQVGVRPSHEVLDDYVPPTRNWDTYLANLPVQRETAPSDSPVSPAMVAYFGTPGYVGRHSTEGRTEAEVRALNTATGSFPAVNWDEDAYVLRQNWKDNAVLPPPRELELV